MLVSGVSDEISLEVGRSVYPELGKEREGGSGHKNNEENEGDIQGRRRSTWVNYDGIWTQSRLLGGGGGG